MRQYIGARYVPKIYENSADPSSAEWEAGTFEPLTIVTYLGSSYISKVEVNPSVGDPAANPTYWALTGSYNGQIAQLQNQINIINNVTIPNEISARINGDEALNLLINTLVNNEKIDRAQADSTLQNNIDNESSARSSADANLQSQINNIIAPTGTAPNPAEVTDARVSLHGSTFTTLGDAIRDQVNECMNASREFAISEIAPNSQVSNGLFRVLPGMLGWVQGSINVGSGVEDDNEPSRIKTMSMIDTWKFYNIALTADTGYSFNYYYYDDERNFIGGQANVTSITWYTHELKRLGRRYIRIVARTSGGSDAITPADGSHITVNCTKDNPGKKIRVMSYNVGRFNYGVAPSGLDPATAADMIVNFKKFLCKYQPDILFMNEFTKTLIQNQSDDANTVLFDPFFRDAYGKNVVLGNSFRSQFAIHRPANGTFITLPSPYNEIPYLAGDIEIAGKHVRFLCVHFVVAVPSGGDYATVEDARLAEMNAALQYLSTEEYAILAGDFNSSSAGEKELFNSLAEAAGFTPANGGYLPFEPTWPYTGPYNYDDNIYVKGNIQLINKQVLDDEAGQLPSDHLPIIADYMVY